MNVPFITHRDRLTIESNIRDYVYIDGKEYDHRTSQWLTLLWSGTAPNLLELLRQLEAARIEMLAKTDIQFAAPDFEPGDNDDEIEYIANIEQAIEILTSRLEPEK